MLVEQGLGHLPRPKEPESCMIPGMSVARPRILPARPVGEVWREGGVVYRQTARGAVVVVPDPPNLPSWNYDFDAAGNARASWVGTCLVNGSSVTTGAGSVLSFNTRTGAVTLSTADVQGVGAFGAAGQLPGTATNDNASAGNVGELIAQTLASGSALTLATNVRQNVVTLALTAGDWDVDAAWYWPTTAGTIQNVFGSLSLVSATDDTTPGRKVSFPTSGTPFVNGEMYLGLAPTRFSFAAPTSVFMVAAGTFSAGSLTVYGTARARRVR